MSGVEIGENGNSDDILSDIGKFGPFQKYNCVLLSLVMIIIGQSASNYMITTNSLEYR